MAPPLHYISASQGLSSSQVNTISHHISSTKALQAKLRPKTRIKMVIITFSRGKYRHKIWVDERSLLHFRLFQYSLVMQIQGQSGTASKLKTNLVKTNNPYGAECAIVSSGDFHYVPTYGFHTGRIQGYLENLKIEFQA